MLRGSTTTDVYSTVPVNIVPAFFRTAKIVEAVDGMYVTGQLLEDARRLAGFIFAQLQLYSLIGKKAPKPSAQLCKSCQLDLMHTTLRIRTRWKEPEARLKIRKSLPSGFCRALPVQRDHLLRENFNTLLQLK